MQPLSKRCSAFSVQRTSCNLKCGLYTCTVQVTSFLCMWLPWLWIVTVFQLALCNASTQLDCFAHTAWSGACSRIDWLPVFWSPRTGMLVDGKLFDLCPWCDGTFPLVVIAATGSRVAVASRIGRLGIPFHVISVHWRRNSDWYMLNCKLTSCTTRITDYSSALEGWQRSRRTLVEANFIWWWSVQILQLWEQQTRSETCE